MGARGRRIAIVGHLGRPQVRREAARLRDRLARAGASVRLERELAAAVGAEGEPLEALARWCHVMVSLGGDGTVLTAGRALAGRRGTLLAVNMGGLGFLAAAEAGELDDAVRAALAGRWPVATRAGVETRIRRARGGRARPAGFALNDAVVRSAVSYSAIHLRVSALGHDLGHLVADGLIAASASGSTAYSLSAGGPLVAPDVDALVVTPACAHALGSRSLVLGRGSLVKVRLISPGPALLVLDGQEAEELVKDDEIELQLARDRVRVYENPARPFLRTLQAKLGWQGSERRSL
ncbi:MAG: NAD(+)/NADH kinase [bacterium]